MRTALLDRDPTLETETVDSYQYAASVFAKIVADGYIGMVKTTPFVYRYLYDRVERATGVPKNRRFVNRYTAANLRKYVDERKPDLVVCTHAFPCGVMSEYKAQFDATLPVVGVVTDFVVHPYWIYPNVDTYAVATPEMAETLVARGVAPERVMLTGIPIDARFGDERLTVEALRSSLDLPQGRAIVLVMGGGVGMGPLVKMMRALGGVDVPLAAAVIVGRNPALERRVRAAAERIAYPLRVRSFVDNVSDYMHASDVLVTKPGGLTTSEALAARLPMVLVKPLPGQEERNMAYLIEREAAIRAPDFPRVTGAVREILTSPERRARLRGRMEDLRHPRAAYDVADRILALLAR